jgi:hypothetical protein
MNSLREHPTLSTLLLAFTNSFVGNYRRLDPERRQARSLNWHVPISFFGTYDQAVASEIATCLEAKHLETRS